MGHHIRTDPSPLSTYKFRLLRLLCSATPHRLKASFTKSDQLPWVHIPGSLQEKLLKKILGGIVLLSMLTIPAFAADSEKETDRLKEAGTVLKEVLNIPDNIPQELLDKAECVIVLPSVKKGAIGIGGSYGRGAMVCRGGKNFTGGWGAPAMYALEGMNIGFQLGGQATDFLILVMNPHGAESLLKSQVKLGADASAAAGPKGRSAQGATDVLMRAEMLSYSRSRGLFAGVSLEGSTLRADNRANEKLYGKKLSASDIVRGGRVGRPASAAELVSVLSRKSPRNKSEAKSLQE
jgi:lipid-binding SYLF domain-containing protein